MNQIKFIILPDGSTMRLSEYRAMCLRDAKTIADHGREMYFINASSAGTLCAMSIILSVGSIFIPVQPANGFLIIAAIFCVCFADFFLRKGMNSQRECLRRRQWIMESLSVAEKAFA